MTTRPLAFGISAALAALFLTGCGGGPAITPLAPKNAVFVMHIQVGALLNNPDLKPLIEAADRQTAQAKPPFDWKTITEIHISGVPKTGASRTSEPFDPCVVLKFRSADDASAVLKAIPANVLADAEHSGKKYKRNTQGLMSFYQPDPQTVVSANEAVLKSYLENSVPPSNLIDAINRPGITGQIRFAINPGQDKATFASMMRGAPPQLTKVTDQVSLLAGSIHVSGNEFFRFELDTNSATSVKQELDTGIDQLSSAVKFGLALLEGNPSMPADLKSQAKPFANETLGKITVNIEGSKVVVALPVSAELGKMARENLAKGIKQAEDMQRMMASGPMGPPGGPGIQQPQPGVPSGPPSPIQRNNMLKQIALGAINHESATRKLPDDIRDANGRPLLSWRVVILPYIEEMILYRQIDQKQAWDSPRNRPHTSKLLPGYANLGANPADPFPKTSFVRFVGRGTLFDGVKAPEFRDIKDGSSNTIFCVEAGSLLAVPWAQPADVFFNPSDPISALGNIPESGFLAVFCDGSSRTIPKNVSPQALAALICPNDGILITWNGNMPTVPPGTTVNINSQPSNPMPPIIAPQPGIPVQPSISMPPVVPQPNPGADDGRGPHLAATLYFANNDDQRKVELFVNGAPWPVPPQRYRQHGVKFQFKFRGADVIVARTSDRGKGELAWLLVEDGTNKLLSYSKVGLPIHAKGPEFDDFAKGNPGRSIPSTKGFLGMFAANQVKDESKASVPPDFCSIWAPKQDEPEVSVQVYPGK